MSKVQVDTIDTRSGTATMTVGSTNTTTVSIPKAVTLGASGTTVTVPSGATLDLSNATQTGVGGTNTPAFHVDFDDSSSTSIAHDTGTKMLFDTERIDTDNAYDNSTNYRFTPQVAGKYFIYASIGLNSSNDYNNKYFICEIRKNGSTAILGNNPSSYYTCATANMIVDMNGSSDYVECFGYHTIGSTQDTINSKFYSFFGGYKLIS